MAKPKMKLGVDWHPEHWPASIWKEEAAKMREAGLEVVRMAEFSWSLTQPGPGRWEWEWLDEAVTTVADAGLEVILCTPSACPPTWMIQLDPSILPVLADGKQMGLGRRRHYSPHHQDYLKASADFAERLARRYGSHRAVIGFQIDNELCGNLNDTGPLAATAFREWLRARHHRLEALNKDLGMVFWNQSYTSWEQIPVPVRGHHPSLKAEFARFTAEAWALFCKAQSDAMRPHVGDRQITTNCHLFRWGMDVDWSLLMREGGLDLFAFDNYSQNAGEDQFYQDMAASLSRPYWILEQRSGAPAGMHLWPDEAPSISEAAERAAQSGASVATYFCWRQPLFGLEQDHGALLDHSGRPGQVLEEVRRTGLRLLGLPDVERPRPRIGVSFLWEDAWSGDWEVYRDLQMERVHAGCREAGEAVRFLFTSDEILDAGVQELLILPHRVVWSTEWASALIHHVHSGGSVLAMPRIFCKDAFNKYRSEFLAPELRELFGLDVMRRIPIRREARAMARLEDGSDVACGLWLEDLEPMASEPIGKFLDGPLTGRPLLTKKAHPGGGLAFFLAGYPDAPGMAAVIRHVLKR